MSKQESCSIAALSEQEFYRIVDSSDFRYTVSDDSMTGDGILPGDMVLVQACSDLDDGDTALVDCGGKVRIGRYLKGEGYSVLAPSNSAYRSLTEGEFRIIGKAVAFISGVPKA